MPKHLYNLPHGSSLPSTSGLADGYPFLVDNGQVRVLYENYAGVWQPVEGNRLINAQTTSYTLVLTDAAKIIEVTSGSATTVTIPLNATVAFPIGTTLKVVMVGAGVVTVVATGGVTLNSLGAHVALSGQFAVAELRKTATDTWLLSGNLA